MLLSKGNFAGPHLPLFDFLPGAWIHDIGFVLFALVGLAPRLESPP